MFISLLPTDRGVVDNWTYLAGRPTHKGVLTRMDLVPGVVAALHLGEEHRPAPWNG